MKAFRIAVVILATVVPSLVFNTGTAQAAPEYLGDAPLPIRKVVALGSDSYATLSCYYPSSERQAQVTVNGSVTNWIPEISVSQNYCQVESDLGHLADSGDLYAISHGATSSSLDLYMYGIKQWSANVTSLTDCDTSSSYNWNMEPQSMADAPDGNIVAILRNTSSQPACPDRLIKIDRTDGSLMWDEELSYGPPLGVYGAPVRLWAYDDKIIVVDRLSTYREFSYAGVEDTSAQYSIPVPTNMGIYQLIGLPDETIYAMVGYVWTNVGDLPILYHKDGVGSGTLANMPSSFNWNGATPLADNLLGFNRSGHFYKLNPTTGDFDDISPALPSGYIYSEVNSYAEDEEGNGLMIRYLVNSLNEPEIRVDEIDAVTNTYTTLETFKAGSPIQVVNPLPVGQDLSTSTADGSLFMSICLDASDCQGTAKMFKVELDQFGQAVNSNPTQVEHHPRTYVAMGDSFSSGEGNPPFEAGTAVAGSNTCHRSPEAYPRLLEEMWEILGTVDFVACSGATTSLAQNGGAGHGAWGYEQTDALSTETEVVTITIGGNDIKFSEFAVACVFGSCASSSTEYQESWDILTDLLRADYLPAQLDSLFSAMSSSLWTNTEVKVFVIGYPYVMTQDSWEDRGVGICSDFDEDEAIAAETIVTKLNDVIETAVEDFDDSRFVYVDPLAVGSPFLGHELCRGDSYFNGTEAALPPSGEDVYVFHPNANGQQAYADLIGPYLP